MRSLILQAALLLISFISSLNLASAANKAVLLLLCELDSVNFKLSFSALSLLA